MEPQMASMDYKLYHEEYMKNHNGSTVVDSMVVVLPAPFAVFIATAVLSIYSIGTERKSRLAVFMVEFLVLVTPAVLCFTVLSEVAHLIVILWMIVSFLLLFINPHAVVHRLWSKIYRNQFLELTICDQRRAYITNFRATVNLITAICILAVDFKIFPRRYAKTENYGYGLMDAGVGLFCLANAITTPEALGRKNCRRFLSSITHAVKSSVPLILLGAARLFSTQQIDYQQHTSEYGVHWNFFITLAVVKIVCTLILSCVDAKHCLIVSVILVAIHEYFLGYGLRDWVLGSTPRDNLIAANREGIVSSMGYVALFFSGIALGQFLQPASTTVMKNILLEMKLLLIAAILWLATYISEHMFGISRRLANTGYCLWSLAYCVTLIAFFLLIELMICANNLSLKTKYQHKKIKHKPAIIQTTLILEAISYNGLFFFLLANLVTGLINITIQTLNVDKFLSLAIINVYMLVICAVSVILYLREIKLKFW